MLFHRFVRSLLNFNKLSCALYEKYLCQLSWQWEVPSSALLNARTAVSFWALFSKGTKRNSEGQNVLFFRDIRGRDSIIEGFRTALAHGRLSHAYLFIGPPGVGKRTFARALAVAYLCEKGSADACGQCRSCRMMELGTHPDFGVVSPEKDKRSISIEQIRDLQEHVSVASMCERGKVFILEGIEWLREEAANALLKTLEEPPPRTLLILVSPSRETLLPTIVSRCQIVRFAPLPTDLILEELESRFDLDESALRLAALFADGSIGQAIEICEALGQDGKASSVLAQRPPLIERIDDLDDVTEITYAQELAKESRAGSGSAESGRQNIAQMLQYLILYYRDVLAVKLLGEAATVFNVDLIDRVRNRAARLNVAAVLQLLDVLMDAQQKLMRNVNQQLLLGNLLLQVREIQSTAG